VSRYPPPERPEYFAMILGVLFVLGLLVNLWMACGGYFMR